MFLGMPFVIKFQFVMPFIIDFEVGMTFIIKLQVINRTAML